MSVLRIEQLSIALPAGAERSWAVQDIHARIEAGQTLCVVGESGSGKSVMATAATITMSASRPIRRAGLQPGPSR